MDKAPYFQPEAEALVERLKALGFKLGGPVTLADLQNYVEGRANSLFEFDDEVMTKETWLKRYADRMVARAAATPDFANAAALATFDPVIWGVYSPEEAADEEISCWGG